MIEKWEDVPCGIYLMRAEHARGNQTEVSHHISLKVNDGPWYDQPRVPHVLSESHTRTTHAEFWTWALANLPVWKYPEVIKQQ